MYFEPPPAEPTDMSNKLKMNIKTPSGSAFLPRRFAQNKFQLNQQHSFMQ